MLGAAARGPRLLRSDRTEMGPLTEVDLPANEASGSAHFDPLRKSSGCAPHLPSRRGVHLVNSTTGQALNIPEKQQ